MTQKFLVLLFGFGLVASSSWAQDSDGHFNSYDQFNKAAEDEATHPVLGAAGPDSSKLESISNPNKTTKAAAPSPKLNRAQLENEIVALKYKVKDLERMNRSLTSNHPNGNCAQASALQDSGKPDEAIDVISTAVKHTADGKAGVRVEAGDDVDLAN